VTKIIYPAGQDYLAVLWWLGECWQDHAVEGDDMGARYMRDVYGLAVSVAV
jgi:hypothetical protein